MAWILLPLSFGMLRKLQKENPKIAAVSPSFPASGQLMEASSRLLLGKLNRDAFSGTLLLSFREKRKKIWFYNGEIFRIQSNLVPELFGRMMIDRNWISETELKQLLDLQRELVEEEEGKARLLGELVCETVGVDQDEVAALLEQQSLYSFLQSFTWNQGEYSFQAIHFNDAQEPLFLYESLTGSVNNLIEISTQPLRSEIWDRLDTWYPESKPTELSRMPLWAIFASCRKLSLSGILSIRRQNKLYEIVVKFGIPLTLYEGSIGQPRQTIVVRQASHEHERFFVDQLYKLFSFLTGSVYFRNLGESLELTPAEAGQLQFRDETAVTRSVSSEMIPQELRKLIPVRAHGFVAFFIKIKRQMDRKLISLKKSMLRYWHKLLSDIKHQ